MTAADLKARIAAELANSPGFKYWKLDLHPLLVEPELRDYYDTTETEPPEKLWLVLKSDPEVQLGYSVIFDEEADKFGLAIKTRGGKDMCIGLYGSFVKTVDSM